jgi:hypothetical protein
MKDYGKGKIYTIRCRTDDTLIYVGSTVQPLSKRLGNHKTISKKEEYKNWLIYKTINGDWNNWHIELYKLYPCNSKEELERKEGEIIRLIGNLNSKIAGRTPKEYREDNKEKVLKGIKEWNENNKDKIAENKKVYYEKNKKAITAQNKANCEARNAYNKVYREANCEARKAYDKEHYEKNKERKAQYNKAYREANKDKIKENRKTYLEKKKALKNNIPNIIECQ